MTPPPEPFNNVHRISDPSNVTKDDLSQIIQTYPVIDNHAHNMLLEEHAYGGPDHPFESITSEASGHALSDHVHSSLAHIRGTKQLAEFYKCSESIQDVKAARYEWVRRDYPGLIKKCFEGTHAIMMDDGLSPELIHPFKWHEQFVPRVCRIARIEAIAAELLEQTAIMSGFLKPGMDADWEKDQTEVCLTRFNTNFRNHIRALASDPEVRGFKSVVCYRTGLDVGLESKKVFRPRQSLTGSSLLSAFHDFLQQAVRGNNYRIQSKEVNDYLVVAVCEVLSTLIDTQGEGLPFQFHTGLGDNDIDLVKANPAYMQPLITEFPNVDFVLLHSSYPYTRDAGYLAANYANAWLDIGEVFPMLSRDGSESVLRQALELTPSTKILWSTDGHFFPETYYLANRQFRDTLEKVLSAYVEAGDLSLTQAVDAAVDIMFWNSNALYRLEEERKSPPLLRACGRSSGESNKTLVNGTSKQGSIRSFATGASTIVPGSILPVDASTPAASAPTSNPSSLPLRQQANSSPDNAEHQSTLSLRNLTALDHFIEENPNIKYIWLQWLDYTATLRLRMVTIAQFRKQLASGKNPGITLGLLRLLQDDNLAPGATATGQFLLMPDLTTLTLNKGISSPSASVQNWWMEDTDEVPNRLHLEGCPRWTLQTQVDALQQDFNVSILMGFEIEIIFMRPKATTDGSGFEDFEPLHTVHSWSNMTYSQLEILPMIEEIVSTLAEVDIHLPQFHSEAAPGQWEFPLPASEPLKAVDNLYKARDIIRNIAKKHGLKATLYPRPFNFTCGSASHAHFSVNVPSGENLDSRSDPFLAGVLEHLPSILAFTLPIEESYQRVMAGIWAGGEWVCWGTQNREAPLRKCGPGHFEMKTIDGIGNMYLSMAATLAAGLHGLRQGSELVHKDCSLDSAQITEEQRAEFGISKRLPNTLEKSLAELEKDEALRQGLGAGFVDNYLAVKRAEMAKLRGFGEEKRRVWLMSRY